ncbi:hypothetical protein D5W64_12710 [Salmonella enterica subsp. enterica serovar Saintpaul]|nr:hypothetical protein [Salmonella enterica subsp. enterica serovar Saintpaul]
MCKIDKEVNISPGIKDIKDEIIEELSEGQECPNFAMEAYHNDIPPLISDIYESNFPTHPVMKTDSRRTIKQGPKGNIYPSPKRRK